MKSSFPHPTVVPNLFLSFFRLLNIK